MAVTEDVFGSYHFLLEISGITPDAKILVGGFKSVSGISSETEVIEFKSGNEHIVRKKPGRTTYNNITLERGFTASEDLWKWRKNIEDGIIDRRSGTITMLDQDMQTVVKQYNFYEAWPCKWSVPDHDSESSAVAIESCELCVEKVEQA